MTIIWHQFIVIASYWYPFAATGSTGSTSSYWQSLVINDSHLVAIRYHCELLAAIGSYWQPLAAIGNY
jgi:hypothetical protein